MTLTETSFFVTGGTLRHDTPSYVERQADADLDDALRRGEFCYVLTSRQMGKSSLMVRCAARLREAGVAVVVLDLTALGQHLTVEQWYDGLLGRLGQQLDLEAPLEEYWLEHERRGPLQRWMGALREVVLPRLDARCSMLGAQSGGARCSVLGARLDPAGEAPTVPGLGPAEAEHRAPGTEHSRLVIFIDEIDAVRSLSFSTDEFFAAIRECYNRRTEDPALDRLSFCLLGVATPSDLIQDTRTTPFNIGRRIELTDFTVAEAATLAKGLRRDPQTGQVLLRRVLYWTGGHPYLTQRLARAVAEDEDVTAAGGVDRLCSELFLAPRAQEQDDNLLFVRERLLRPGGGLADGGARPGYDVGAADVASLLDLYGQVWAGKRVSHDDTNPLLDLLRLSGIARLAANRLAVRNRIYRRVFDRQWIMQHMPDAEVRRQKAAFRRGLARATAGAGVMLVLMAALSVSAMRVARDQRRLRMAAQGAQRAAVQSARAERRAAHEAVEEQRRAQAAASREAEQRHWAEKQRRLAVESADRARKQEHLAHLAQESEREARRRAERLLYVADMRLAGQAWENGSASTVRDLLLAHLPKPTDTDLRGFDWRYQWHLLNHSTGSLRLRKEPVSLAFGPEGELMTVDRHAQLQRWDSTTGRAIESTRLATTPGAGQVAFTPDGRTIALESGDGGVRLFDAVAGQQRHVVYPHLGRLAALQFLPNNNSLITIAARGTAKIWNLASLQVTEVIARADPTGMFSPDGRTEAVAIQPGMGTLALVSRTGSGENTSVILKKHYSKIAQIAYAPDGKLLATGDRIGNVILWDPAARKDLAWLNAHSGEITSLGFSLDGSILATGSADGLVKLWDVASHGERLRLKGHTAAVTRLVFSPDGKRLASVSADRTMRLWDLSLSGDARVLTDNEERLTCLAFAPHGQWLATGSYQGTLKLWNPRTGRVVRSLRGHTGVRLRDMGPDERFAVTRLAFSPDGRTLATGGDDSRVILWDPLTGRKLRVLIGQPTRPPDSRQGVGCLAFSPDGKILIAGFGHPGFICPDYPQILKLWEIPSGRELRAPIPAHRNAIAWLVFSPSGRLMATASHDRTVKLWTVRPWTVLHTLPHNAAVDCVAFSPDGQTLATGTSDGTIRLWDVATGRGLRYLHGHGFGVSGLAFSPDGGTLVSTSYDRTVKLWNVATAVEIRTLLGHTDMVLALAFSADGNTLATASFDTRVRIWQAASLKEIAAEVAEQRAADEPHSLPPLRSAAPRRVKRAAFDTMRRSPAP